MKQRRHCVACDFITWKYKNADVVWELIEKSFRPIIGITKTKKFNILSIMENI